MRTGTGPLLKPHNPKLSYWKFNWTSRKTLFMMTVPCFILMAVFAYLPLSGWIMAFYDYKPGLDIFKTNFVGLKYFKLALGEPDLIPVLRNTLALSMLGILCSPLPALFAIFLSEMRSKAVQKFIQTTTTFPYFISWILVFSIAFTFFSTGEGFLNQILLDLKFIDKPLEILGNSSLVWPFHTLLGLWKGLGFSAIIYLAAIAGIDQELYDAASVDGAARFHKIVHITLPGMYPTYFTLLILAIGGILSNGFEQYYLFTNPLVQDKIQVLDTYVYRIGIAQGDFPLSTALGMTKTLISVVLLFVANLISKRLRGTSII
ncbi:ABC transporter permease [Cohnella abietis]|uniref:Sugar ABC transporter permease n=1 Tax=Cohnella abietis TaxID=2507935 RepID=A0A3T1DEG1_9BACL|nr:ABC transporter permease subunit [Cohnella abietis]BBI36497.1 sugar ABC transporter permease [Cohnella abietis]